MDVESIKILLVEDNPGDARLIQEMLRHVTSPRITWRHAGRLERAVSRLAEEDVDLVLLDLGLPDGSGLDTFIQLHSASPHVPVIVLTGMAAEQVGADAIGQGAQDYLVKGQVQTDLLLRTIRYAISRHRIAEELRILNDRLEQVVDERTRELTESEVKHRTLIEQALMGIVVVQDNPPRLVFANHTIGKMLGHTPHELVAMSASEVERLIHPDDRAKFMASYRVSLDGEEMGPSFEFRARHRDGSTLWLDLSASFIIYNAEPAVIATFVDVTERRRAEDALAAEKERLAVTLAAIGDGVIATDTEGSVVLINEVAQQLTDYDEDEAIGQPLAEVYHVVDSRSGDPLPDPVASVIASGEIVDLARDVLLLDADGAERDVAVRVSPIRDWDGQTLGVVLVIRDTEEARQWEEERARNQRIESLGVLAAGIAHDFNNLLTGILGNVTIARLRAAADDAVVANLSDAEVALEQATGLVRQLMGLSQGESLEVVTASVAEVVHHGARLATSGSGVRCEIDAAPDLWNADVDPAQMGQVINNLVINAEQAMPGGGVVRIKAVNSRQDDRFGLGAGRYVEIAVSDQGIGIPPEHLDTIFDPYFTTKQKGSGLGLTVAHNIVARHGGALTVDSQLGAGTTFCIHLPASSAAVEDRPSSDEPPRAGTGRILVMDDEELVRTVCGDILEHLGYAVVRVESGEQAVEEFDRARDAGRPFDLVIVDLTVPGGMGGAGVLQEVRKRDASARVVASSGYFDDPAISRPLDYGFTAALTKPYSAAELSRVVDEVLSS